MTTYLQIVTLLAIGGVGLFLRQYLRTYMTKKGENLATKEDIGEITHRIEEARTQYLEVIERLRASLADDAAVLLRRRTIYESAIKSLRIFVAGTAASDTQKIEFLEHYQALWLWASDAVVRALNSFLEVNKLFARQPSLVNDQQQQAAFAAIIIAMRQDIGFPNTTLQASDYQFIRFV